MDAVGIAPSDGGLRPSLRAIDCPTEAADRRRDDRPAGRRHPRRVTRPLRDDGQRLGSRGGGGGLCRQHDRLLRPVPEGLRDPRPIRAERTIQTHSKGRESADSYLGRLRRRWTTRAGRKNSHPDGQLPSPRHGTARGDAPLQRQDSGGGRIRGRGEVKADGAVAAATGRQDRKAGGAAEKNLKGPPGTPGTTGRATEALGADPTGLLPVAVGPGRDLSGRDGQDGEQPENHAEEDPPGNGRHRPPGLRANAQ